MNVKTYHQTNQAKAHYRASKEEIAAKAHYRASEEKKAARREAVHQANKTHHRYSTT